MWGSNEPPLEPKLFSFQGGISRHIDQTSQIEPPIANLNPRSKNPGSAPAVFYCTIFPGWIKDQTGDWEVSFYVTAMMLLIPAIMMLLEPLIIPDQKKLERENPYVAENGPQVMPADKVARLNTIDHETDSLLAGNQEEIIRHRPSKIYKAYGNEKTQADSLERTSAPLASPASI